MNDSELEQLAESLLDAMAVSTGHCQIESEAPWLCVTLDRDGCVALAASLLRIATQKPKAEIGIDQPLPKLKQVQTATREPGILVLRLVASLPKFGLENPRPEPTRLKDRIYLIGCGALAAFCIMSMLTGVFVWLAIIFGFQPWSG